ncbi:hypothetical protein A9Q81_06645 [Gammaproteobacteria bacterium 42_54_T18]|nr:hypothetical protein A9Q81_06645 [Gammaproteobacteria bacterium 42_54_T18]
MKQTTVYLVDDEPDMLELLASVVEMSDMLPVAFTQASDFFQQVTELDNQSIMALDLHMPEMDGIEVMRRLATMDNTPRLILMSGHDEGVLHSAEKLGRAHNLKIITSLKKPIVLREFQQLLVSQKNITERVASTSTPKKNEVTAAELKKAIEQNELVLHYQPQIIIATGELSGVEALVRWNHPERGVVFPDEFISLAEEDGLMKDLTRWVIDQLVKQEQLWQHEVDRLEVSVNISAIDITSLTLPEQLAELLAENKLSPSKLTLEVTESALMGELVKSLDILTRLRMRGIGLSIDDFGTGYSSLSQLHRVPFTELKIDQSFVYSMLEDDEARAIVKTCVMLGHELKMKVVAEGVETKEHLDLLREIGCDIAQGYYFSRAIPADEMTKRLHSEWP